MGTITTAVNFGGGFIFQGSTATVATLALRDLSGIVTRTVAAARGQGRDYMAQSRAAATAVMAVRPDLSLGQALDAVERLRA